MDNQSLQNSPNYSQPLTFPQPNDEIDLRELFVALWKGKLIIIACTFVFAIGAVFYALNQQEWWSSKAKVAKPQPYDFSEFQQQVRQFQPVFDIYQEDGTVLVSDILDDLVDPEVLFQRFVDAYNSSNNKKTFLDNSSEFQAFKNKLNADADADAIKEQTRKLYAEWFQKITAVAENKKAKEQSPFNLSLQATTKESGYSMLNEYIAIVEQKVFNDELNNLQAIISSKRNELTQQKAILETQAKNRLTVEIERAQYALGIAKAAQVNRPIQGSNSNELFVIDLGSKGIEAKIKALKTITNLSLIEPKLQQSNAKIDMLNTLKINRDISFQTFRFLENVEQPITRDKPKRALIAAVGTLLGGMLGVAIVLVRFAFRRKEEA